MFDALREKSRIIVYIVVAAFVVTGGLMGFGSYMSNNPSSSQNVSRNIATVNGEEISREEYMEVLRDQAPRTSQLSRSQVIPFRYHVLESIIERRLVLNQAEEMGITVGVTEEDIQEQIDQILKENDMSEEELSDNLEQQNYSMEQFRDSLRQSLRTEKLMQETRETTYEDIEITEEEIEQTYQEEYAGQEDSPELSEVKGEIEENLREEKQDEAYREWVKELKASAEIEINDPTLKGYRALENEDYDLAISNFQEILGAEEGGSPGLYTFLAQAYQGKGNEEKAVETFQTAVTEYPDDWELHLNFGDLYRDMDKRDKALEQYDKASDLAGEDFMAHYQLYEAYSEIEAEDKAAESMQRVQEIREDMMQEQQQSEPQESPESIEEELQQSRENQDN